MTVEFRKHAPSAGEDVVTCIRADRSRTEAPLARPGVLPTEAIRCVVESTLGWRDGLYGAVAAGGDLAALRSTGGAGRGPVAQRIRMGTALAECLAAAQWAGAGDATEFASALTRACRKRRVTVPEISPEELAGLRAALREFGAAWRPLPPGGVLRRSFTP